MLFYKIVYGLAPQYLQFLLQQCILPDKSYPLRNQDNLTFHIPQAKTTSFMKSFLPSTIRLWNDLPFNIRNLSSLTSFKTAIKNIYCIKPKKYYNYGSRKMNILHCQLRNNASNLNADLFNHFLKEDKSCDMCGFSSETSYHYFMNCPKYCMQRQNLIQNFNTLQLPMPLCLQLILNGDNNLTYNQNIAIFKLVQEFVATTKRFA